MGDASEYPMSTEYFQPAEHLPHSHTLMAFPNLPGCYQSPESTDLARREVVSIAMAISEFEPVVLYAHPSHSHVARELLTSTTTTSSSSPNKHNITIREAEVDNLWIRDLGPVFLHSRSTHTTTAAADLNFNYWGHKAEETVDGTFARRILEKNPDYAATIERVQARLTSEGGALEVDGHGTLLATDTSIINSNRNPGWTKPAIEAELKRVLGVQKIIWLRGVNGLESTDWHIDAWARFVRPGVVLLSKPPRNAHQQIREIFDDAMRVLAQETDALGRKLQVVVVDEPDQETLPRGVVDGMVTSYVNYLLVNGGVVMARFGDDDKDRAARHLVEELFPDRKVVQVYINELPRLGGGIHCATQHVPK